MASNRAHQSHAQAEAITASITREELSSRIDSEFDNRINALNYKLASHLSLIEHFRATGNEIYVRSFKDSVEIGLVTAPLSRADVDIHRVPIGDAVELWVGKGRAEPIQTMPLIQVSAIASLIGKAPHWLATYFSDSPQFSKLDNKSLKIKGHGDWLVFQLRE